MKYISLAEAKEQQGLRLVLTMGMPGPWGLAARTLLDYKGIEYVAVAQIPGESDSEMRCWTGQASAPVAVLDDEPPRAGWLEQLYLAERLAPEPRLIPQDAALRSKMFGLIREITGEQGYAWLRRLIMFQSAMAMDSPPALMASLTAKYGYSDEAASQAWPTCLQILDLLASQLRQQELIGSLYFIGDGLSALDIYWATFSHTLLPPPHDFLVLPTELYGLYRMPDEALAEVDGLLLEHRDFIYREHLTTPIDFSSDE